MLEGLRKIPGLRGPVSSGAARLAGLLLSTGVDAFMASRWALLHRIDPSKMGLEFIYRKRIGS